VRVWEQGVEKEAANEFDPSPRDFPLGVGIPNFIGVKQNEATAVDRAKLETPNSRTLRESNEQGRKVRRVQTFRPTPEEYQGSSEHLTRF